MAQYSESVLYSKDLSVQYAWQNLQKLKSELEKTPKSYAVRTCDGGGARDVQIGLPRGTVPDVTHPVTGKQVPGCLYAPSMTMKNYNGVWISEMEKGTIPNPKYKDAKEAVDMAAKNLKDLEKKNSQKVKDDRDRTANRVAESRLRDKGVSKVTFDDIEREKKIMEREADREKNKSLIPGKKGLDRPKGNQRAKGKSPGRPRGR